MRISPRFLMMSTLALSVLAPAAAKAFEPSEKDEIKAIVKSYIQENPEIIVEALTSYQMNAQKQAEQKAEKSLDDHYETLIAATEPSIGNPDAEITVVEFFDYNCGYCKRAFSDIQKAVEDHDNLRIVFQELPILGENSLEISKWSLAAQKQDKYFEYHTALMEHRGRKSEDTLIKIAEEVGLDTAKLKEDAESKEITEIILRNRAISNDLGVRGTPAFIINKVFYRGYLGEGGLDKKVTELTEELAKSAK